MIETVSATLCPRCGVQERAPRLVFCWSCCVSFDDASLAAFERAWDELAVWIVAAEQALDEMGQDHPKYASRLALAQRRLKNYQALCYLVPERVAERGSPMPNLTYRCPNLSCNAPMVKRTNRHDGSEFYGCTRFPDCTETREIPERERLLERGEQSLPGFEL